MTDERLRALYGEALDAAPPADEALAPTPEQLRALVAREGSEEERLATLDRALASRASAHELELLRALRVSAPAARRPFTHKRWMLAASLLAAVTAGALVYRTQTGPARVLRGANGPAGVSLLTPAPADAMLRWHAVPGAVSYLVEVVDADGGVVVAGSTTDTTFDLPPDVRPSADSHDQWWVRARLGNGSEMRSALVPLEPAKQ